MQSKIKATGGMIILFLSGLMLIIVGFYAFITSSNPNDIEITTQYGPFYLSKIIDALLVISFVSLAGLVITSIVLIIQGVGRKNV